MLISALRMFTQLPNLGLNVLQIHKGLRPLLLIPQKRRRVIDGGHLHAAPLEPLPMLLRDFLRLRFPV